MRIACLAAVLVVAAGPAFAQSTGRIACDREVGEVVGWADANPQAAARVGVDDWIEVLSAQCRHSVGLARSNMNSLWQRLERETGPQVGYAADAVEWPEVNDRAD